MSTLVKTRESISKIVNTIEIPDSDLAAFAEGREIKIVLQKLKNSSGVCVYTLTTKVAD